MATLDEILKSRDERQAHQQSLLRDHPGQTLLCLTVVMPGKSKRNSRTLLVAQAAVTALLQHFGADKPYIEVRDLETGYEAFLLTSMPVKDAKRAVCRIEEAHPLGRLFDIDVITQQGPVSRAEIGLAERSCLLCGRPARECMRAHRHTAEELHAEIERLIDNYCRS